MWDLRHRRNRVREEKSKEQEEAFFFWGGGDGWRGELNLSFV